MRYRAFRRSLDQSRRQGDLFESPSGPAQPVPLPEVFATPDDVAPDEQCPGSPRQLTPPGPAPKDGASGSRKYQ